MGNEEDVGEWEMDALDSPCTGDPDDEVHW